ncbi:Protein of unknown function, partial [Halolactibacillus halophilus]
VENEKYVIVDQQAFHDDYEELLNESFVIDGGDHQEMLKTIKRVLDECDKNFSGQEAVVYDYICEQFERGDE